MKNNLIFIGMPSSGKTILGRLLAAELGRPFIDTDDVIRQINGCELHEIMNRDGLDGFLQREVEAIRTVDVENTVIATGGSAVYSPAGMEHLKKIGTVIYVAISYETLERRVGDPHLRGVVLAPVRAYTISTRSACRCMKNTPTSPLYRRTAKPHANPCLDYLV